LGEELLSEANRGKAADGMAELLVDTALAPPHRPLARAEVRRTNAILRRYAATLRDTSIELYARGAPPQVLVAA
jgi:hypothetical protein